MYNQNIKERFVSEMVTAASNKIEFERRFDMISWHEEKVGKDIAEMSAYEAKSVLDAMEFVEYGSLNSYLYAIKKYVRWCQSNGIFEDCQAGVLELSRDDIDPSANIAKTFFRDEQDLLYAIKKVRSISDGYPEVIAAIFLWLGVGIKESVALKECQVDLSSRKVFSADGKVIVDGFSDTIYDILSQYCECQTGMRGDREVRKDMSYDTFIKRFTTSGAKNLGKPLSAYRVRDELLRMNTAYIDLGYGPRITPTNILRSGSMRRIYELEQSGVDVEKMNSRDAVMQRGYRSDIYRSLWQYKYYKKAFNL